MVSFEGSAIFIPGPFCTWSSPKNGHPNVEHKDPFELIPLITKTVREFDLAKNENNEILRGNADTHSDDLNACLYSVRVGSITKTRYSVTPMTSKNQRFATTDTFSALPQIRQ